MTWLSARARTMESAWLLRARGAQTFSEASINEPISSIVVKPVAKFQTTESTNSEMPRNRRRVPILWVEGFQFGPRHFRTSKGTCRIWHEYPGRCRHLCNRFDSRGSLFLYYRGARIRQPGYTEEELAALADEMDEVAAHGRTTNLDQRAASQSKSC